MLENYIEDERRRFIVKRILRTIPVVIIATIVIFSILHLTPGNPARIMLGPKASAKAVNQLEKEMGLHQPLPVQYFDWMSGVVQGDLGVSIRYPGTDVLDLIMTRLPLTLQIMGGALALSTLLGITMGVLGALHQNTWLDYFATIQALFWRSIPSFWLGIMLLLIFSMHLGLFPMGGTTGLVWWVLPVFVLGLRLQAIIARLTRSSMLDVLSEEYMKTAKAKGLSGRFIIIKHGLRNALIPVVTIIALRIPWLFSGAMVTEVVFALNGMGRLIYRGVLSRDYPVVQACVLIMSLSVIIANLIADIAYTYIDPRIEVEEVKQR